VSLVLTRSSSGEHFSGLLLRFHAPALVVIRVSDTCMNVVDLQFANGDQVANYGPGVETDLSATG
jgi:hypothetical protein